jgi:hypothetical protein
MVATRRGRLLVATVVLAAIPAMALAQVTAVLDKDGYREGEQMWLTVNSAGKRLARPRVYLQARPGPVDLDSPLREEFGPLAGTVRLAVRAPAFVTGTLADGAPFVLGPGAWTLHLYDGSRLVTRVPFRMLPAPEASGPGTALDSSSGRPLVLQRLDSGPLTRGQAFTLAVAPAPGTKDDDLVLQWAMAAPAVGGPPPPEPPGAFAGAVPVPRGDGRRTVEVFAPYALGRFELRLMSGAAAVAALTVEVR